MIQCKGFVNLVVPFLVLSILIRPRHFFHSLEKTIQRKIKLRKII